MFNPYRDTQAFIKEHGTTPDEWLTMWLDPDLYCTLSDNTTNKETANWARSLLANEAPIGAGPIGPHKETTIGNLCYHQ